jgi:hypothetical protein
MGLADRPGFGRYHEVLSRARWDARDVARGLLLHLLAVLSPAGEGVIGIDDTIERRWGANIEARGIYRDSVRSSHGHFVKTSDLRWLSLAVMLPVPFAGRRWASLGVAGQGSSRAAVGMPAESLPFLSVLAQAAMVGFGHPAHNTSAAWTLLAGDRLGAWIDAQPIAVRPHPAAWYHKNQPTGSDAIAAVCRVLWSPPGF